MKLIAITGNIGCGKTTIAKIIQQQGLVVFDVDAWVRRLYYQKSFIAKIAEIFPSVVKDGHVDKRKLRNIVFNNNIELKKLEALIHPFIKIYLKRIINKNSKSSDCLFLDVALLFEMDWDKYCHKIIVADVDYEIQKKRVMKRDNVEAEDFDKINNVQMNNEEKKQLADYVIDTNKPRNLLRLEVIEVLSCLIREEI